jgi:glycosyltransferase involved in cell wall biosynthesis
MASQASVAAAFFKMANRAISLILTVQEGDEETHLKRYVGGVDILYRFFVQPWHQLVFKKANYITVISHYLAERAKSINSHVPITIVPNGVDVLSFSKRYSDEELASARKEIGKTDSNVILITTSRLVTKNAVGDIIAALPLLPTNVRFAIAGQGNLEEKLKAQVAELKLENRVIFLGQRLYSELPQYLQAADIFIRPSLSEGMGNSFIEAMAAGIPVIATPVGGIPDFLKDKETGIFVNVSDPKDIAEKVQLLIQNPELKNKITAQAKKLVTDRYDWSRISEDMNHVFKQVL